MIIKAAYNMWFGVMASPIIQKFAEKIFN